MATKADKAQTDAEVNVLNKEAAKLDLEIWELQKKRDVIEKSPMAHGEFTYLGIVAEDQVHNLIDKMEIWSKNHPGAPITLTINSQGGVVVDGFALYDYLQRLKHRGHKLTTVALGLAASMGGVLLQAGDIRIMAPRSWLMMHEVQGVMEGSFSELQNVMGFNKSLQEQVLDILSERSEWTRKKLKMRWKEDIWMDANDALKAGFVDAIEE